MAKRHNIGNLFSSKHPLPNPYLKVTALGCDPRQKLQNTNMHACSQKLGRIRRMRAAPGLPNLAIVHFLSTVNTSLFKSYLLNVIFPKTKQNALLELTKNCRLSTKIIVKSHCSRKDLNVSVLLALLRIFCSLFKCNIHTDIINSKSYPLLLSLMITLIGAKNSITLELVM